jgi:hypothetical protein
MFLYRFLIIKSSKGNFSPINKNDLLNLLNEENIFSAEFDTSKGHTFFPILNKDEFKSFLRDNRSYLNHYKSMKSQKLNHFNSNVFQQELPKEFMVSIGLYKGNDLYIGYFNLEGDILEFVIVEEYIKAKSQEFIPRSKVLLLSEKDKVLSSYPNDLPVLIKKDNKYVGIVGEEYIFNLVQSTIKSNLNIKLN